MTNGEFSTDLTAAAAVGSPIWLPWLHTVSDTAALMLPILGGTWLAVQIYIKIRLYLKND